MKTIVLPNIFARRERLAQCVRSNLTGVETHKGSIRSGAVRFMLMDERRMTGITAQDFAAKKDPATPPPEYVAEQVGGIMIISLRLLGVGSGGIPKNLTGFCQPPRYRRRWPHVPTQSPPRYRYCTT